MNVWLGGQQREWRRWGWANYAQIGEREREKGEIGLHTARDFFLSLLYIRGDNTNTMIIEKKSCVKLCWICMGICRKQTDFIAAISFWHFEFNHDFQVERFYWNHTQTHSLIRISHANKIINININTHQRWIPLCSWHMIFFTIHSDISLWSFIIQPI